MTNSIGVFAAKERDQSEMESTVETKEQRQVRREQACVNLERPNAERREDRLRGHGWETRASESGEQREARLEQVRLHDKETRASERGQRQQTTSDQQQRLQQRRGTDRERGSPQKGRLQQQMESQRAYLR